MTAVVLAHRPLTASQVAGLRRRMHDGKAAYVDHLEAKRMAARTRRSHPSDVHPVAHYPCPFEGGRHWHVGHCPSMRNVELLADFLRFGSE